MSLISRLVNTIDRNNNSAIYKIKRIIQEEFNINCSQQRGKNEDHSKERGAS